MQEINENIFGYLSGSQGDEESKASEEWINSSPENQVDFNKIKKIWELSDTPSMTFDASKALEKVSARLNELEVQEGVERKLGWQVYIKYAAVFVIVCAVVSIFFIDRSVDTTGGLVVYESGESVKKLKLSDGTEVYLNKRSSLKVSKGYDSYRSVKLEGEAYFDVAKDQGDFVVELSEGLRVQVLGTEFNVKNGKETSVVVTEGKVNFSHASSDTEIDLIAGQEATFSSLNKRMITSKSSINNDLSWKTNELAFESARLEKVIEDIARHYDITISVDNQDIMDCKLTASFSHNSFYEVLEVLKLVLKLEIQQTGDNEIKYQVMDVCKKT